MIAGIGKLYRGANEVTKVYLGTKVVYNSAVPFIPTDIAGSQLWLDGADATTISIGTGVSQWNDKSGLGNHAAIGTGSLQPAFLLNQINGLSALSFNGSNRLENSSLALLGDVTIFSVTKSNTLTGGTVLQLRRMLSNTFRFITRELIISSAYLVMGDLRVNNIKITAPSGIDWQVPHISKFSKSAGASPALVYKLNDTAYSLTGSINQSTSANNGYDLGAIQLNNLPYIEFYNGLFAEFIVYNSILTTDQEAQVYTYLSTKWAI